MYDVYDITVRYHSVLSDAETIRARLCFWLDPTNIWPDFLGCELRTGFGRPCVSAPSLRLSSLPPYLPPFVFALKVHRKTQSRCALKFVQRKNLSKKNEELVLMEVCKHVAYVCACALDTIDRSRYVTARVPVPLGS